MKSKLCKIISFVTNLKLLAALMFLIITAVNIKYPDQFLNNLPLYFSIVIMLLAASANRYTYLFGGLNSILYGVVFFKYRLFASLFQTLAFSAPFQLFTFASWSKRKYKHSVEFRSLSKKQSVIFYSLSALACLVLQLVLPLFGASQVFLDNTGSVLAIMTSVLSLLRFKEFIYFQWAGVLVGLIKYILMLEASPEIVAHTIYHIYSLICLTRSYFSIRELYSAQNSEKKQVHS